MHTKRWAAIALSTWAGLALTLAGLYAGNNPDTFGHLAQGRQIVALGYVPKLDTFSLLTPPRPFVNYEWLTDVLYALLERSFGYDGILALKCLALFVTGWVLVHIAQQLAGRDASAWAALVITSTIPAIRIRLSDRPHVLGTALAALTLLGLSALTNANASMKSSSTARTRIAALCLLQVAWVNLHGSHLLGTLMVGTFLLCAAPGQRAPYAALLGLHGVAACISPYGPAIVLDAIAHVFDPRYRSIISEWLPWDQEAPAWLQLGPTLQAALLTIFASQWLRVQRRASPHALLSVVLAVSCFRSIRFIAEFMLLSSPLLAAALAHRFASARAVRLSLALLPLCSVASAWGAAHMPPNVGLSHGARYRDLPRATGSYLREHVPSARVFAEMDDGWFLMSELPEARFIVDGRSTFYGPEYLQQVATALEQPAEMLRRIESDHIDAVVLRYTQASSAALIAAVEQQADFARALIENDHVLYLRRDKLSPRAAPLRVLRPRYDTSFLHRPEQELQGIERELALLAQYPNTQAFVAFTQAVLLLRPLVREGENNGVRAPGTAAEQARIDQAALLFDRARAAGGNIPAVTGLAALIYALDCQLDKADAALLAAREEGESRESLFASQELRLRRGETEAVARFVAAAKSDPRAANDGWLRALEASLRAPPNCSH